MTSSSSRLAVAALCAAALLALCRQVSAYSGPTGMALLQDVDNLPRMNDDVNVFQSSSHDRGGGNYDSGNFVTVQAGEYVMLDTKGPGEIARLWLTNASPNHRVRVYLDGEATPRIDRTVTELFSGAIYPFVWPLVGNDTVSSGGYYSYVPIPYSNGCKITTTCKDLYYNVQYRSYLSAPGITSYDTCCDPRGAIASWAALAHRRRGEKLDRNLSVRTGTSADLFDVESGGRLTALRINVKGLDDDSRALKALRNLRLRVYWDDSTSAAIDAPIGPFHCVWFPQSVAKGLFLGSEKRGDFYCYYPMPFARRARIALANQSAEDLEVSASLYWLQSAEDAADLRAGKLGELHTVCRSQTMKSGDPDYLFADLKGRGIALGASALMIGAPGAGQGFLEGDERIYYDGNRKPQLHGTGTEDFFNGGYYFDRGLFTLPLHGYNGRRYEMRDQEAMYRLFLADRIFYRKGFVAGIEHGATNDQDTDYASVFYYYAVGPAQKQKPGAPGGRAAEQAAVSISGRVTLPDGEPVAGAVVEPRAVNSNGNVAASSLTCPDGTYAVRGLSPAAYNVRVESALTVPRAIYGVSIVDGKPTQLDVEVKSSCANLVVNGDFADGFENGVARGWKAFHTDNYSGEFRQGDGPVQFIHTPEPVDGDSYLGLWQMVKTIPGQLYAFSAQCRTLYTGDEENAWDNVMGKLCVHPRGLEQFRSKDIDFVLSPAEHGVWHTVDQKFAMAAGHATLYLAAWRKFPRGGDQADVEFRNVRFVGPTVPPPAPSIARCTWVGNDVGLSWEAEPDAIECWYAISATRNEQDIVVPWTRAEGGTATISDSRLSSRGPFYALVKCVNALGVESEIRVERVLK